MREVKIRFRAGRFLPLVILVTRPYQLSVYSRQVLSNYRHNPDPDISRLQSSAFLSYNVRLSGDNKDIIYFAKKVNRIKLRMDLKYGEQERME